jgi:23S rRNA U2552 (ribose-2'-O)-methylase RlmE/FtsJ
MDELTKLGVKYKTDKAYGHQYTPLYHKYFKNKRNDILKILEIGIYGGSSLRMWEEYFPKAKIYGIDIEPIEFDSNRIITFKGNQGKRNVLEKFVNKNKGKFDIIIDDGSHRMDDQQISLAFLFKYVKKGGYYIIEDLDTSLDWQLERYNIMENRANSTYNMLNRYNKSKKIKSFYINKDEKFYLEDNIDKCNIHKTGDKEDSMIVFIKKK